MSCVVPVVQADRETWERALEIYDTGFDRDGRACSPDDEIARYRIAETARLEAEIERLRGERDALSIEIQVLNKAQAIATMSDEEREPFG